MERLTTRLPDGQAYYTECHKCEYASWWDDECLECDIGIKQCRKLTDYEDAEEQGRLVEFPVAIGQHLWMVDDYGIMQELVVHELVQSADGQTMLADSSGVRTYYSLSHIGENIFPTREQAEARLKELEGNNAEDH